MVDEKWKKQALEAVREVAEKKAEFTADDVWATGLKKPGEARVLGPIMSNAKRNGWIEDSGRHTDTKQSASHSAPIRIWSSKIQKKGK